MIAALSADGIRTSIGNATSGERLLKMREVVALTNCHPNTIRRATSTNELPCFKLPSGARRFRHSEVLRWLGQDTSTVAADEQEKSSVAIPIAAVIRVSSQKQGVARGQSDKSSLEHQQERVAKFIVQRWGNMANVSWYRSIGSGLDFNRPAFLRLVEHILEGKFAGGFVVAQDFTRVARFGVQLVNHLCKLGRCELIYTMDEQEAEAKGEAEELTADILAIMTHFTAKASGAKAAKVLTVRVQPETVEEIWKLGRAGYSHPFIAAELLKQGRSIGECGRTITRKVVARVLAEHGEGLSKVFSVASSTNSFLEFMQTKVRLTGNDETRCRQTSLITRYRDWCRAENKAPMSDTCVRKMLKKHYPQLSTKLTNEGTVAFVGLTFVNA
jgi:predicted site-specific integrase-resolvase